MKNKEIIIGHIAMIAANVIWGLMSPIGKEVLNSPDISPLALTGIRIIGAAVLFWIGGMVLPKSVAPKETIERKDYLSLIIASLLIICANQMCIVFGMSMTSPVDATVMCSTSPFFTLLLVWLLWSQRPGWAKILGVVFGFAGMLVFILGGKTDEALNVSNPVLGNIICILSQVFGAIYMVKYAFLTRKYSPFTLMKWLFTISAVVMTVISAPSIINLGRYTDEGTRRSRLRCRIRHIHRLSLSACRSARTIPYCHRDIQLPTAGRGSGILCNNRCSSDNNTDNNRLTADICRCVSR